MLEGIRKFDTKEEKFPSDKKFAWVLTLYINPFWRAVSGVILLHKRNKANMVCVNIVGT